MESLRRLDANDGGSVTQKLGATITINDNGGDDGEDEDAHADADTPADAVVWFTYAYVTVRDQIYNTRLDASVISASFSSALFSSTASGSSTRRICLIAETKACSSQQRNQ